MWNALRYKEKTKPIKTKHVINMPWFSIYFLHYITGAFTSAYTSLIPNKDYCKPESPGNEQQVQQRIKTFI
jgi:hypothetical protein